MEKCNEKPVMPEVSEMLLISSTTLQKYKPAMKPVSVRRKDTRKYSKLK